MDDYEQEQLAPKTLAASCLLSPTEIIDILGLNLALGRALHNTAHDDLESEY
ncbi:hypothetical protein O9992_30825 [Vibrio lentus]|nr:hypothetical protein [Vibrio lentus]